MFYLRNSILKLLLITFCSLISATLVFANEEKPAGGHGEEKKPEAGGHGEEKKDEGGHGGAAKKEKPEWMELLSRLAVLNAKITAKDNEIKALMVQKQKESDDKAITKIVNDINKSYKEMNQMKEEAEQTRSLIRFRFPEKSAQAERAYKRSPMKTVEEMEAQFTVEGKIKRTMKKLQTQYGQKESSKQKAIEEEEKQNQEKGRVTEPAVLSK